MKKQKLIVEDKKGKPVIKIEVQSKDDAKFEIKAIKEAFGKIGKVKVVHNN